LLRNGNGTKLEQANFGKPKQETRAMTSLFVNLTLPKNGPFAPFLREFLENTATSSGLTPALGKTAILLLIANEVRGLLVVAGVLGIWP
jgi:hypothetical protein